MENLIFCAVIDYIDYIFSYMFQFSFYEKQVTTIN